MGSVWSELRRRNVFRVAIAYAVAAWLLIEITATTFPILKLPNWSVTLVTVLMLLGFPPALILAWAFELTPAGIKLEKDVVRSESITHITGRKLDFIIIAVLVLALVFVVVDNYVLRDEPAAVVSEQTELPVQLLEKSVAVLPFANRSASEEDAFFVDGLHDDLLTHISKIGAIKTISRTSVMQYRDTNKTIPQIADELGVATIVQGGVQRAGDTIRINVQLIDAATDEHLWANTYDKQLTAENIFSIQSEIATAIAETLRVTLTPAEQQRLRNVPTRNITALETYFLGKQLLEKRTTESLSAAVEYFQLVIKLDPEFALAYSGLADAYMILPEYSPSIDLDVATEKSVAAATRALSLDPDIPEVLASMAWNRLIHHYDWAEAEALLRRALKLQPNNTSALHWLSHVLSWQGQHEEAIRLAERAVEVDPLSTLMRINVSYILADAGDHDTAIDISTETWERDPNYPELMGNLYLIYLRADRPTDAAKAMQLWAATTGRDATAIEQVGNLLVHYKQSGEPVHLTANLLARAEFASEDLAQLFAFVGDSDNTLDALERATLEQSGSRSVLSMKVNPLYYFIRANPRFVDLMVRVGLLP